MAENETTLEDTLCEDLSNLITADVDTFITNALGSDANIEKIQKAANRLKNKHRTEIQNKKRELRDLISEIDSAYKDKTYHYRVVAKDMLKDTENNPVLLGELKKQLGEYEVLLKKQEKDEKLIHRNMIKFQKIISKGLSLDIVFVHTSGKKASAKKYSRTSRINKDILDLLTFESDQKVSLSLEENNTENLANIIKEAINEELKNEVQKRNKLEKAVDNEERTYNEIKQKRFKTFKKGKRVAWVISNGEKYYWQTERISNMGPIEEARQRILFQIHLDNIQKLFSSDLTEPISGEGEIQRNAGEVKEGKEPKDKTLEVWIHHFIRSKQGVAGVDKRSGLIIDDTLLETKNLLKGVKEWLGIDEERSYVSIASKTDNPNFAGYVPFLDFIDKLTEYKLSNKKEEDKEILKNFLKKEFFDDGARITGVVEDIAIEELNEAFNSQGYNIFNP